MWKTALNPRVCLLCKERHGKIYARSDPGLDRPPLHAHCKCALLALDTIAAGTATMDGTDGADYWLARFGRLPDYYIAYDDAKRLEWKPELGNLAEVLPGRMIARGRYFNRKGKLPSAPGRVWYEADINYRSGYRNKQRVVYSNDGIIFVTYDHYETFFEIVGGAP